MADPTLIEQVQLITRAMKRAMTAVDYGGEGSEGVAFIDIEAGARAAIATLQGSAALPSEAIFETRNRIAAALAPCLERAHNEFQLADAALAAMRATTPTAPIQDTGASANADQALAVPVEPVARLDPAGFDPSRIVSGENYDNAVEGRTGNWMQTFRGGQFWPLDMRPADIFIEDIAHALSLLCRYGGHCDRFYSVAEHSVLVSLVVPPELALLGLLHDATEAYVGDVIRPLKPALTGYKGIEHQVWLAIASRFGLPGGVPDEIKAADNAVLLAEQLVLMKAAPAPWRVGGGPADVEVVGLCPEAAEEVFLTRFDQLSAIATVGPKPWNRVRFTRARVRRNIAHD